jgi:molecular chaperone DnaJ
MQQGFFTMERTCPTCGGRGQIVKNPCKACGGRGQTRTERKLSVDIPAGVEDGTRLRVAGEGEPGARGGPRGDLYVFLGVKPHDIFQRNGADLYVETPVPMTTAALGGSVEAPTIDGGRVRIEIPAGAQAGQTFRLRGKGMSRLRTTQRGDMHVGLAIEIPRKLSAKQRALLEEFAATCDKDSHPAHHGFFDKVKGFWDRMTG